MKMSVRCAVRMVALCVGTLFAVKAHAEWPRQTRSAEADFLVYQPQLEAFKGNKVKMRTALRVSLPNAPAVYSAVSAVARIAATRHTRQMRILDIRVLDVTFGNPDAAKTHELDALLRNTMPTWVLDLSMDRFLASLDTAAHEALPELPESTDAPTVMVATEPTVLVFINGEPRTEPLQKGRLLRIVNTPFFIVYDPRSRDYYLKAGRGYMTAKELEGTWQTASTPPSSVVSAATAAGFGTVVPGAESAFAVRVTTQPAALIQTNGDPRYSPAPGGGELLFVKNSPDDIFLEIRQHRYYILISGRWFSNHALEEGQWEPVPPADLPEAFALIPPDSSKSYILPHVSGTRPAREAALDTLIPQTTSVKRTGHQPPIRYQGEPQFARVPNLDAEYVTNSDIPVFRVGEACFCCHQGIWYTAEKADGVWDVCTEMPPHLQALPADFPLAFVRYATVYDVLGDVVFVGYTPGYLGGEATSKSVVFGNGMAVKTKAVGVPHAASWGVGAVYNPWTCSWAFRLGTDAPRQWLGASSLPGSEGYSGASWWGPGGFRAAAAIIQPGSREGRTQAPEEQTPVTIFDLALNRDRNATTLQGTPLDLLPMWTLKGHKPSSNDAETARTGAATNPLSFETVPGEANTVVADRQGKIYARVEDNWRVRKAGLWNKAFPPAEQGNDTRRMLQTELDVRQRGTERTEAFRVAAGLVPKPPGTVPTGPAARPPRRPRRWR